MRAREEEGGFEGAEVLDDEALVEEVDAVEWVFSSAVVGVGETRALERPMPQCHGRSGGGRCDGWRGRACPSVAWDDDEVMGLETSVMPGRVEEVACFEIEMVLSRRKSLPLCSLDTADGTVGLGRYGLGEEGGGGGVG